MTSGVFVASALPRALLTMVVLGGTGAGLAATNPGPEAFAEFAGERLSREIAAEVCRPEGLPMMLRLVIRDCPGLVQAQKTTLGRLALDHSHRSNLGLLSLYRTDLGGASLGRWRLPRFEALTLAVAGRFLLLSAQEQAVDSPRP